MLFALFALLGGLLALWGRKQLANWVLRRRFRRGAAGESQAVDFLEDRGFSILGDQVRRECDMWIDGEHQSYRVRADFLVSRGAKRYVVEVKTGRTAPDPKTAATRRQLLEYGQVYDCDGLLLLDMTSRQLMEIRFANRTQRPAVGFQVAAGLAFGLTLGLLIGDRGQALMEISRLVSSVSLG